MAENLTPKKYIDSNNMKQILTAVKNEISNDNGIITTEAEYLALPEEQKLNNSYYLYDIGVHYKNGVAYSRKEPIQLTMEEYKALGEVDPDQEYIISADEQGILLEAVDIGYNNAVSNLPCTTVQGVIDELSSNLGGLGDNINGFKNVQIVSALGSVNLKEIIQSEFPKLKNGRGMIRIFDGTTLYCGTYIKYSNTQGSATFTNVEGTSYIWIIKGDTATLQELATMDKVKDGYAKILKNADTDTNEAMFIAYKDRDSFGIRIYKDDNSEHELNFSASGISYMKNGVTIWTK